MNNLSCALHVEEPDCRSSFSGLTLDARDEGRGEEAG